MEEHNQRQDLMLLRHVPSGEVYIASFDWDICGPLYYSDYMDGDTVKSHWADAAIDLHSEDRQWAMNQDWEQIA